MGFVFGVCWRGVKERLCGDYWGSERPRRRGIGSVRYPGLLGRLLVVRGRGSVVFE